MQRKKIVKSFKDFQSVRKKELFFNQTLKKGLDKRFVVSIARQLAEGFDTVDLRKEPTKSQYSRARKVLQTFYEGTQGAQTQLIRPTKKNRKIIAQSAGMPPNFKVYGVATPRGEKTKIEYQRSKDGVTLVFRGKNVVYRQRFFKDKKELVKNPKAAVKKLTKKSGEFKQARMIVGAHTTLRSYGDEQQLLLEAVKWQEKYGERLGQFWRGIEFAEFVNQKKRPKRRKKNKKADRTGRG
jgi:hypothetical protein